MSRKSSHKKPEAQRKPRTQRSDLPFGSEFSPSQTALPTLLEIAQRNGGDWKAFEQEVRATYFEGHCTSDYNKGKLANNTKLGMIAYGIIDRDANLTEFGQELYEARANEEALYEKLARHILLHLHGVTLVQCVQDIHLSGETVTLIKLREWLSERGIYFPSGGKHPSIMRLWLEKAGVFYSSWRVNETRLQELLGISPEEIEALAAFTPEQKSFLKTLANIGESEYYPSNEIAKLAAATYGVKFNEKNLPKQVLNRLEEAGYITRLRGTRAPGRGAKADRIQATEKLCADLIVSLLNQLEQQTAADLRPFLRVPLSKILAQLKARDKHTRGLALEALALRLMRLIDIQYVATRLRGSATGGAEVDLVFESARLVFSRWQVQCKNTSRVALDDVAKEVGLTHFLKSNAIVIVTTGQIGPEARRYANKIMTDSNLCIIMVDGDDVQAIVQNPTVIVDTFNREARQAMKLKALDL